MKLGTLTITAPKPSGVTITGTIISWDKDENAEIRLYDTTGEDALTDAQIRDDMRNKYGENAIAGYEGTCKTIGNGDKPNQYRQRFTISDVKVEAGTYKLAIFKPKRNDNDPYVVTVMDVPVGTGDVDLTESINMWLYGDVNYDGRINAVDVAQLQKRNVGMPTVIKDDKTVYSIHQFIAADISGDGKLNAIDVAQLQKRNVGMPSKLDNLTR